jgi:hypothetical protein
MDKLDKLALAYHPPHKHYQSDPSVSASKLFYHAILLLQKLGVLPITSTSKTDSIICYNVKIKSLPTLWCLGVVSVAIIYWISFVLEALNIELLGFSIM